MTISYGWKSLTTHVPLEAPHKRSFLLFSPHVDYAHYSERHQLLSCEKNDLPIVSDVRWNVINHKMAKQMTLDDCSSSIKS
mmetsp:Transcript_9190/g.11802  ORF Transcript_9190/g.11802 Transcript_9190/m.11802 type:complete len:81 (+) Transcript_9190:665-907(+)